MLLKAHISTIPLQLPKEHFMTEEQAKDLAQIYINLIVNTMNKLLDNDITFSILVTKNPETIASLPSGFYGDKEALMFNISEWAFEEAYIDTYSFKTMVAIDGENGETGEFTLSVPFLAIKALIVNDVQAIIVNRPFDIEAKEEYAVPSESSEPQVHGSAYSEKHTQFEQSNKDGIAHSMSKLKLCTPGE